MYLTKPVRKTAINPQDKIVYTLLGYKVIRKPEKQIAQEVCPRIKTPYGMAPDLHIQETGNGLCNLVLWSTGQSIAHALTMEKAKEYINGHYIALFRKNQKWWNFYHETYEQAMQQAIELTALERNVSTTEAEKICMQLQTKPPEKIRPEIINSFLHDKALAKGYENLLEVEPGEAYKETLQRVMQALNQRLPIEHINAITRHLRRKFIYSHKNIEQWKNYL